MTGKTALAGVFALALVSVQAMAEDKTYAVDDTGYIHNWLALSAIALNTDVGAHTEEVEGPFFKKEFFEKQKTTNPAEDSKVTVDEKELVWKAVQTEGAAWSFEPGENTICFGATYIVCDQDIPDVILSIGSDDSCLWTLNGAEVVKVFAGRGVTQDQDKSQPLTLKKGTNVLSVAVINGGGPAGASARFLDKDGNPVKTIKISLTPPSADAAAPVAAAAPADDVKVDTKDDAVKDDDAKDKAVNAEDK